MIGFLYFCVQYLEMVKSDWYKSVMINPATPLPGGARMVRYSLLRTVLDPLLVPMDLFILQY